MLTLEASTKASLKLQSCLSCVIRQAGICSVLSDAELADFHRIGNWRTFRPGEHILSSEDDVDFLGAIRSGVVKVIKILHDGRQQIVGLLFPPNCLGHTFSDRRAYIVEAATPVEICCFNNQEFEKMAEKYSGLNKCLLAQAVKELDAAQDWMVLLGQKNAEEKVASFLLLLANQKPVCAPIDGNDPAHVVDCELHLNREEIADCVGLTYETVCRQIAALKKRDIVRFSGPRRFSVPDIKKLAKLAG